MLLIFATPFPSSEIKLILRKVVYNTMTLREMRDFFFPNPAGYEQDCLRLSLLRRSESQCHLNLFEPAT